MIDNQRQASNLQSQILRQAQDKPPISNLTHAQRELVSAILPFGTVKGYALALAITTLSGVLSGSDVR